MNLILCMSLFAFITKLVYLYLYSLVTVDGVGVLVMGLLVTVHAVVGIVAVAAAVGREAA